MEMTSRPPSGRGAEALAGLDMGADPAAFNVWLHLPEGRSRADIVGRMAGTGIGVMPSDPFTILGTPPEALRICLGGEISREGLRDGLSLLANILDPAYWHG